MRLYLILIAVILLVLQIAQARPSSDRRILYETVLRNIEAELAERELRREIEEFAVKRLRRRRSPSEKKAYPKICYFSPIQCMFTREEDK